MMTTNRARITKDAANKKLHVVKELDAAIADVWKAWTQKELLDLWWAPKPWKAETKSMDFRENGVWLYCMVGPEGERHWARVDYKSIVAQKSFTGIDGFCDENGKKLEDFPSMDWTVEFSKSSAGTTVQVSITFATDADLEKIIAMGFEEGFTMALGNLDELLAK